MRLLAWFCGLLLVANVAVYLWPDKVRTAPHIYAPKPDVNPHFVRLNKEIEDKYLALPAVVIEDDEASSDELSADSQACLRLGPFMHKANYELAQAVLFNANVEYSKSTRAAKQSVVYRVYLGPFAKLAEATDTRVELKRKNILDHFVRKEGESDFLVSLGIYTTEESAIGAVELFDGRLDSVKLKQESIVLPDSYWLHFSNGVGEQSRQQLAKMDWGEQSAKLGSHACQAPL